MIYRATKKLTIETDVVHRVGLDGEHTGTTCVDRTVMAGEVLTTDLVIAASRTFVDADGQQTLPINEDGGVIDVDDPEADGFVDTYQTQLQAWVDDGSLVIERE